MRTKAEGEALGRSQVQRHTRGDLDRRGSSSPAAGIASSATAILNLQRTAGNQATLALLKVQRTCQEGHSGPPVDHRGWTGKSKEGRDVAMDTVCRAPKGSNGEAMCYAIGPFFQAFGNFAGGKIGAHYQEPEMLERIKAPCTKEGLEEIAHHETVNFWRIQTGLPGLVGRAVSEKTRAGRLISVAKERKILEPSGEDNKDNK